jgi:ribosome-binding factor A
MPREFPRSRRIEDQVQRILSEVLRVSVRDPRLGHVIITAVKVSRDLSVAWVYFTSLDLDQDPAELQSAFGSAMGFLRSQLAKQLTVRQVPELRFKHDDSMQRGSAMDRLIDDAIAKDQRDSNESENGSDDESDEGNGHSTQ